MHLATDLVELAARRIENEIIAGQQECWIVQFHCDERILGTPYEGILAVHPDGMVRGMNRSAKAILSMPMGPNACTRLNAVFDADFRDLAKSSEKNGSRTIRIRSLNGALPYVRIYRPDGRNAGRTLHRPFKDKSPQSVKRIEPLVNAEIRRGLDEARRALDYGLSVSIEGETGTGKEIAARTLHTAIRPDGPFVALNCAAVPETLIESELFGYEDGTFTGARKGGAKGKIEQASGGVLFLDEIGDMPFSMQSRLLRVIQERSVCRLGASSEVAVDFLLISATHQNLNELVLAKRFREDLFYRLCGYRLHLPPLRQRSDFTELLESVIRQNLGDEHSYDDNLPLDSLMTPAARGLLRNYGWPGNIRQLDSVVRCIVAMRTDSTAIDTDDLPAEIFGSELRTAQRPKAAPPEN